MCQQLNNEEENETEDFRQTNGAENDDENQGEEQVKESKAVETSKELPKTSSGRKIKAPKKLDL